MTQNLSTRITVIITNLDNVVEFANTTDLAYNTTVGTPENYKAFGADNFNMVISNGHMSRAVANSSLIIAQLRGDTSDEARLKVIQDIADWSLAEDEKLIVRCMANATWWVGNAAKDLKRATRPVCKDYGTFLAITGDPKTDDENAKEIVKDDNLLAANAKLLLQKLQEN